MKQRQLVDNGVSEKDAARYVDKLEVLKREIMD